MEKKRIGIIGHVDSRKLAVGLVLSMMMATTAPQAVAQQDMGKMMDRRITALDNQFPCYDGKRGSKRAKRAKLHKNPNTRWRV